MTIIMSAPLPRAEIRKVIAKRLLLIQPGPKAEIELQQNQPIVEQSAIDHK
jgi:hypothetical protein